MVSITEHADDSPTGKLMEAIIESVDEFYSENLATEVLRGMREAASRGFWVSSHAPFGYNRIMVPDGPKKRPTLEINPDTSRIIRRIFDLAEAAKGTLEITRILNNEGIASPRGKLWGKTSVHGILTNQAYTGTLVWGEGAKDKGEPVRVEKAFPAVVSKAQFRRVNQLMRSRAPKFSNPRRVGSSYLLSGLAKCQGVQLAPHRTVRQERPVRLLRLPDQHQGRQARLRDSHAQRPPLRGTGGQQDSLQHPHRGQHPRPGEGGRGGDGRRDPGAAQAP